jgi:hypothetical protein
MTIHWPASTELRRPVKRGKRAQTTKRQAPERAIQVAIVKALKKYASRDRCYWFAVPNGGFRHIYTAQKLKAEGTRRGTPDLCFVLPFGLAAFLELKAEKGRQSPDQILFQQDVEHLGARYAVAHSIDEAWGILAGWGVLPSAVEAKVLD